MTALALDNSPLPVPGIGTGGPVSSFSLGAGISGSVGAGEDGGGSSQSTWQSTSMMKYTGMKTSKGLLIVSKRLKEARKLLSKI